MKLKILMGIIFIAYSILIAIQISISKEILEIKKILWKVAEKESKDVFFENAKK